MSTQATNSRRKQQALQRRQNCAAALVDVRAFAAFENLRLVQRGDCVTFYWEGERLLEYDVVAGTSTTPRTGIIACPSLVRAAHRAIAAKRRLQGEV